jgi:hypothetical protein
MTPRDESMYRKVQLRMEKIKAKKSAKIINLNGLKKE